MTRGHHDHTQAKLRKLYVEATELDQANLDVVIDELKTRNDRVCVLDIGCGSCPYGRNFLPLLEKDPQSREGFQFWESSPNIEKVEIEGNQNTFEFSQGKGLYHVDALSELTANQPAQQYDLVVLFATLHELVVGNSEREDCWKPFLTKLLDVLHRSVKPNGYLLVSDFFVPPHLFSEELQIIHSFQQLILGHGDSPLAFCDPKNVILAARKAGFRLDRLNYCLPLQDYSDDKLLSVISIFDPVRVAELKGNGEVWLPGLEEKQKWSQIAHLLRQRPYFSAILKAEPATSLTPAEKKERTERYKDRMDPGGRLLRLVTTDAMDADDKEQRPKELSAYLDDLQTRLQTSTHLFRPGKESIEAIRDIFEESLGGLQSIGSCGVFGKVAGQVNELVQRWLIGHQQAPVHYLSTYLGINSEILAESGKPTRFLPTYTKTIELSDGTTPIEKRARSFSYIGGRYRNDGNDWTTIGLHHLLSPYVIQHGDGGTEYKLCGPSVHEWFTRLQESRVWKRSLTIWCPPAGNTSNTNAAARMVSREQDRIMATAFQNTRDSLHQLVCLDDEVTPFEYGDTINASLENLTGCAYCAPPKHLDPALNTLWLLWLKGVASVWYDFLFLSRNVSTSNSLAKCLDEFEERWTNPNSSDVLYVDLTQGLLHVGEGTEVRKQKCLLPKGFDERIRMTVFDAKAFLGTLGEEQSKRLTLINSMVTLSLTNVGEYGQSYGTFMMFTDGLLDWRLTDLVSILVQRPYHLIREIEGNLKTWHEAVTTQKATETSDRQAAIAGFTHQVSHVLDEKSGHPLREFAAILRKGASDKELQRRLPEDLGFRAAQIEYACILPQVFADAMGGGEQAHKLTRGSDVKAVVQNVWDLLIFPCARIGKENEGYGIYQKTPKLVWDNQFRLLSTVPDNDLVRALLFEAFWNACRHGDFSKDVTPTVAEIRVGMSTTAGAVTVQITNPVAAGKFPDASKMKHMRAFIKILRSWEPTAVSELFGIGFCVERGEWKTTLYLPVIK